MKTNSTINALKSATLLTSLLVSPLALAETAAEAETAPPAPSAEAAPNATPPDTTPPDTTPPDTTPPAAAEPAAVAPSSATVEDVPTAVEPSTATAEDAPDLKPAFVQRPYMKRYIPEANSWELGLFGGIMFPSSDHQLFDPSLPSSVAQPFKTAGVIGARVAYFPLTFVGIEAEGAAMPSELEDGSPGGLWSVRGHILAQLPGSSLTPFALFGAGALGASSNAMGNDADDLIYFGLGAKLALDDHVSVRLDLRDNITRRRGGSAGEGAHSPEVLFGITFTPTRRKPDNDGDTVLDSYDECPTVSGLVEHAGCPAPDGDGDGVEDSADECPDASGPAPSGCPVIVCPTDTDKDGLLDPIDQCPSIAGAPESGGCPPPAPEPAGTDDALPELPRAVSGDAAGEAEEGTPVSSTDVPSNESAP